MLYAILLFFLRLILRILFRLEIIGEEYVPRDEALIVVVNHTSYLDPVVMGIATPQELNYMAKKELFKNVLFRWLITSFGAFPLSRQAIDRNSLNHALGVLAKKEPLLIFPGGTRSDEGVILPSKPGVGMIVYKSKARVVPAFMKGSSKILPRNAKFLHFHKLKVRFGKPLVLEKFFQMPEQKETYELIAQEITSSLKALMQNGQ